MSLDKLSALISTIAALSILAANYWQWWDNTYDGGMKIRKWALALNTTCLGMLLVALILLIL
jgi:hypothetical protein